jgi:hypothetical protein
MNGKDQAFPNTLGKNDDRTRLPRSSLGSHRIAARHFSTLITGGGQALITSTTVLDLVPESGSSTRSR